MKYCQNKHCENKGKLLPDNAFSKNSTWCKECRKVYSRDTHISKPRKFPKDAPLPEIKRLDGESFLDYATRHNRERPILHEFILPAEVLFRETKTKKDISVSI